MNLWHRHGRIQHESSSFRSLDGDHGANCMYVFVCISIKVCTDGRNDAHERISICAHTKSGLGRIGLLLFAPFYPHSLNLMYFPLVTRRHV